jgi:phage terminase large subunit-like protein
VTTYTLGDTVIEWIEAHCVYPSGDLMGRPFVLLDWQREWVRELYRCDRESNLAYRWALLGVPKKNGKSSLIAALALYHLLGDPHEADPWVVVAAAADRQADIVFNACKRMCEYSPALAEATERYRWEIKVKGGAGKLERVAASAGKLDGKNISMLIIDELHEWQRENWTILTNGTVGRKRAQIVQITTAGWDRESICYTEFQKGQRIAAGEVENPSYHFRWYGAPEGADHRDDATWADANPSYGTLVTAEVLRDKLINVPESEFRRYFLNQWVEVEDLWLPAGAWDACRVEDVRLRPDVPTFIGWDASTKYDSTAIVAAQEQDERYVVKAWVWERPLDPNGDPVEDWAVPGAEIAGMLRDLWRHELTVQSIAFDPAFVTWLAQELQSEGLPMVEWPQTDNRMVPATQAGYEAIVKGVVAHDGDPVLARHVRAAVAVQTFRGGTRITKGRKSTRKIDAAVALLMALDMLKRRPPARGPAIDPTHSRDSLRPEMAGIRTRTF